MTTAQANSPLAAHENRIPFPQKPAHGVAMVVLILAVFLLRAFPITPEVAASIRRKLEQRRGKV